MIMKFNKAVKRTALSLITINRPIDLQRHVHTRTHAHTHRQIPFIIHSGTWKETARNNQNKSIHHERVHGTVVSVSSSTADICSLNAWLQIQSVPIHNHLCVSSLPFMQSKVTKLSVF